MLLAAQALVNAEPFAFAQGKLRTQNTEAIGAILDTGSEAVVAGCSRIGERRTEKRLVRFWKRRQKRLLLTA